MNDPISILIVEDEPIVAVDIKTRLRLLGYRIIGTAATGENALALVEQHGPSLVLMDIRLKGGMDGIETAMAIRRRWRLPVIFLTAYSEDATLERAKLAEPYGYLLKPFEERELMTTIEMALYKHRTSEEIRRANRLYAVLSQVNQAIVRVQTRQELFDKICRIAVEFGQFKTACLDWIDEATGAIVIAAQSCDGSISLPLGNADQCQVARQALSEGKPCLRNRLAGAENSVCCREYSQNLGINGCGALPIRCHERICCVLRVGTSEADFFNEAESKLLEEVALDISFALDQMEKEAQRRQLEAACRASEERYRQLVDFSPDPIMVHGDGKVLFVNTAGVRLAGASCPGDLIGRSLVDLVPPGSRQRIHELLSAAATGSFQAMVEERLVRLDGTVREVELASGQVVYEGQPAFLVVVRDITERKLAEQERERLQAQLIQAQKMEAIGQLAGGVAHDFNNILTAIMLQLCLLQTDEKLGSEVQAGLCELEAEAQRATALIRQLLLFSRREVVRTQALEFNSLLGNLLKMLRRVIGEHIDLELHGASEDLWLEGDPGMVEQVVMNLVVNARDAMPGGGRLTLRTDKVESDDTARARNPEARAGRFIRLTVSDTGCGMDPATMKRIFEPFFTTKEAGKGTGLGLATVYGIVKQHQGWVEVRSSVGKGSAFSVYLPAGGQAPSARVETTPPEPMPGGHETLLLVEDDKSVRAFGGRILRQLGYRVIEAGSAQEALHEWEINRGEVDLLLTDMVMPGGTTGLELAEQLIQQKAGLKAILVSGYSAEREHWGEPESKRVVFMAKPLTGPRLAKAVRDRLDAP